MKYLLLDNFKKFVSFSNFFIEGSIEVDDDFKEPPDNSYIFNEEEKKWEKDYKWLELDENDKYITFREKNDFRENCIKVSLDFKEPNNILEYKLNRNTLEWEKIEKINNVTENNLTLDDYKKMKLEEIEKIFFTIMANGILEFTIPSSNTKVLVDARRSNINNDLQNVEGLIELIQSNIIQSPIMYKCADNNKYEFTLSDLQDLKMKLMQRGSELYSKKHHLEELVNNAETIEDIQSIKW